MRSRLLYGLYALTIFVSAFLLFQIQPLIGKCLLPWFGGTPNVWTTCLLFFQTVLFAGYVYAHVLTQRFPPATQALIHLVLLACTVLAMAILPGTESEPDPRGSPVVQLLVLLAGTVGLPYFVLSTSGPLLQSWFSRSLPGRSPYRLYALSNAGSLLALVSYPFLFEPLLPMPSQATLWMQAYLVFALLCGGCAWLASRQRFATTDASAEANRATVPAEAISPRRRLAWFSLAMTASVMLLATTNQVCLDVAVIPFLWVAPLGLYLLTFILCFDGERWYSRSICGLSGAIALVLTTFLLMQGAATSLALQASVAFGAMFLCCMVCHGELVRLKPAPEHLTGFYLTIAAGGAVGGLFVGIIAPLVFPLFLEMHLAIAVCCGLALWVFLREKYEQAGRPEWLLRVGAVLTVAGVVFALQSQAGEILHGAEAVKRNFYGVLRVEHEHTDDPQEHTIALRYGKILHGVQFVAAEKRRMATSYYGPDSGIGRLMRAMQAERPQLRIGVVGLGVGTLAAYSRTGDVLRFYEINPDVISLAHKHFTFLSDAAGTVEIVPGDARLTLDREADQHYDLLVLDAFSGDAIPTHLLTREALDVYLRHLAPNGVLAVHISNLHFDLRPVVAGLADHGRLHATVMMNPGDASTGQTGSVWFAAAEATDGGVSLLSAAAVREAASPLPKKQTLWTDDFSNLFTVLK